MLELMTPYEMLDLARSHVNASTDDLNRLYALSSAYLIVAYRVGRELTKFQVSIINVGFIFSAVQALWGLINEGLAHHSWIERAWGAEKVADALAIDRWFGIGTASVLFCGIFACVAFMWSVRHPKKE